MVRMVGGVMKGLVQGQWGRREKHVRPQVREELQVGGRGSHAEVMVVVMARERVEVVRVVRVAMRKVMGVHRHLRGFLVVIPPVAAIAVVAVVLLAVVAVLELRGEGRRMRAGSWGRQHHVSQVGHDGRWVYEPGSRHLHGELRGPAAAAMVIQGDGRGWRGWRGAEVRRLVMRHELTVDSAVLVQLRWVTHGKELESWSKLACHGAVARRQRR